MRSDRVDEIVLVRYLLAGLTEEEQVQVEDRAFADSEYLCALESVEADLIDAYVRGELSEADRRGFERRFLTSPARRSKVEFARALAKAAAESKAAEFAVPRARSAWGGLVTVFRGWNPVLQFAAGFAMLICVAGASWLMVQNTVMRSRVAALEAQRRDVEIREQGLRRQLSEQQRAAQLQRPPEATRMPVIASLVLLPGLSRAESRVTQLVLDPSAQLAHIEIQLEARDDDPRFRAELRGGNDVELLVQSNLLRHRTAGGYQVAFDVPASVLAPGNYELALKAIPKDQSVRDVGYYYFTVRRQ